MKRIMMLIPFCLALYVLFYPVKKAQLIFPNYEPIQDETLAKTFAPQFYVRDKRIGFPIKLYYRMSRDLDGLTHIAYHPVWNHEQNFFPGIFPWLSRNLYTGGLSLQRIMFGKGDVESLYLTINKDRKIIKIVYERPSNYTGNHFKVKHTKIKEVVQELDPPLYFEVLSWNHLFNRVKKEGNLPAIQLSPQYFTKKLWEDYRMLKNPQTPLFKNRAHFGFEREVSKEETP
jgi:hypothetical protein